MTIAGLRNHFLASKLHLLNTSEISPRTFHDYKGTTDRLVSVFGKERFVDDLAADDFRRLREQIAEKRGSVALVSEVGRVRSVFKYAFDSGLIDKPVRFGPTFKKPSKKNAETGTPEIRFQDVPTGRIEGTHQDSRRSTSGNDSLGVQFRFREQ